MTSKGRISQNFQHCGNALNDNEDWYGLLGKYSFHLYAVHFYKASGAHNYVSISMSGHKHQTK